TSSTGDLMTIGLVSDKLTLMQLRTLTDWVFVPRLLAVPGVAKASVYGGGVPQIQILIDPAELIALNLSIGDARGAARRAWGGGGAVFIDPRNQGVVIRTKGEASTAADIGRVVVSHQPSGNVTLSDVGRVADAPAPPISDASVMGKRAVIINMWA